MEVKLKYDVVMQKLNGVQKALDALTLPEPPSDLLGINELGFTTKWKEREGHLHKNVSEYKKVVLKNVEDTRANVDLLKKQDEAVVRN
ncbi:YwqI/YxiC family protein [Fictibacillus sp. Mic-4]|uniref:YwqI/YxiC family protein n=1 Tax=Fictibacillus TaxID=1329200 RepID=UPI00040F1A0E|nr:YwqI/YxiC family protein [Fictibacillus gelatini]